MRAPDFDSPNYMYKATVVRIIDGDTIDVNLDVGFHTSTRKRLRLLGINAWEIRGKEKGRGIVARMFVQKMVEDSDQIYVQTEMDAKGKFGRLLAWVWAEKDGERTLINKALVEQGHAREREY